MRGECIWAQAEASRAESSPRCLAPRLLPTCSKVTPGPSLVLSSLSDRHYLAKPSQPRTLSSISSTTHRPTLIFRPVTSSPTRLQAVRKYSNLSPSHAAGPVKGRRDGSSRDKKTSERLQGLCHAPNSTARASLDLPCRILLVAELLVVEAAKAELRQRHEELYGSLQASELITTPIPDMLVARLRTSTTSLKTEMGLDTDHAMYIEIRVGRSLHSFPRPTGLKSPERKLYST